MFRVIYTDRAKTIERNEIAIIPFFDVGTPLF